MIDNFSVGGMAALIDMETGRLKGSALTKSGEKRELSPTGILFDGYEVPYWGAIRELILTAARVEPHLHFVAWDVAVAENGPLLVEGNVEEPGMNLPQLLLAEGTKYMLEDILRSVKKAKKEGKIDR